MHSAYLGDIIPEFHDDMAYVSLCKIDSSTDNGVAVSIFRVTDH